ncbi:MAG TPA: IS481 family transposase [Nitriliruptorales bacterium]|nr:IS481 family transposase [Nitriliruptorales bacterium]
MRLHANATTCPKSRLLLCQRVIEQGWSRAEAAAAAGTSERTAAKWLARYRDEGAGGLLDRSSTPASNPKRVPDDRVAAIAGLRELRMTAAEIAEALSMPPSTVSVVLRRIGLGKRSALEPFEPPNRYERRHPGELVHIDIKKLGMIGRVGKRILGDGPGRDTPGAGWEFVHVAVDDATRLAYVEVLENEKASTSVGFLRRAVRFFDRYDVRVQRVMTDNGSPYVSTAHSLACRRLGIRHLRTRPYRPRTNGKAERFIRTMLGGWAYGAIYRDSWQRRDALAAWLDFYNHRRPHGSLGRHPPAERLARLVNNVSGSYS